MPAADTVNVGWKRLVSHVRSSRGITFQKMPAILISMIKRLPAKFTPIESQRERKRAECYDSHLLSELNMTSGNQIDTSDPFTHENVGRQFSWAEVSELHKTRNGIYQRNGTVISLLTDFGKINPCYPDFHGDTQNTIHYTGSGR